MAPGYAAFFMWVASAVLWWSGWREETAQGIPDPAVAVFLAGWPFAAWKDITLTDHVMLNGAFLWTGLALLTLAWSMESALRFAALSAGFLAGSLEVLLKSAEWLIPFFPDWLSDAGAAILAGILCAALVRGAAGQIVAASLAVMLPECLPFTRIQDQAGAAVGASGWTAGWWLAVIAARLSCFAASGTAAAVKSLFRGREGDRL